MNDREIITKAATKRCKVFNRNNQKVKKNPPPEELMEASK